MSGERICVVGGGAAGLTAAWTLQSMGFGHITVLEREQQVGGKCHTHYVDGKAVELGAFTLTPAYTTTMALAEAVGVQLVEQPSRYAYDLRTWTISDIAEAVFRDFGVLPVGLATLRYYADLFKWRDFVNTPGFGGLTTQPDADVLCGSSIDWILDDGLLALQDMLRLPLADMGYGSFGDLPTAYLLKYLGLGNFTTLVLYGLGLESAWPKRVETGFQSLWEGVAAKLPDVRTEVEITAIARDANGVHVTTAKGTETYDQLVLACPLDAMLPILDCSPEEQRIFSKIEVNDYQVMVARASGIPNQIIDAVHDLKPGYPWEILQPWPEVQAASFYLMPQPGQTDDEMIANVRETLANVYPGAQIHEILEWKKWRYFPHFHSEDLAAGIYDDLEALQGTNRTCYAGGLLAFETVETVAAYSKALVERLYGGR